MCGLFLYGILGEVHGGRPGEYCVADSGAIGDRTVAYSGEPDTCTNAPKVAGCGWSYLQLALVAHPHPILFRSIFAIASANVICTFLFTLQNKNPRNLDMISIKEA